MCIPYYISAILLISNLWASCEDETACNFGEEEDCVYAEENHDCEGNCDTEVAVELWDECYSIATTTSIDLSFNNLWPSIPPGIGDLIYLTELRLNYCNLTGEIPPEIGNLTNLEYLFLYNNSLSGQIPAEIGNLTNLITLDALVIP